jgi:hypothetical protein
MASLSGHDVLARLLAIYVVEPHLSAVQIGESCMGSIYIE